MSLFIFLLPCKSSLEPVSRTNNLTLPSQDCFFLSSHLQYNLMSSRRRSIFRPCIDLHQGVVKQIVGASLQDDDRVKERALASSAAASTSTLKTNFISTLSPAHYAKLYRDNNLRGGHVIKLGPGNEEAAEGAIYTWRDGLHVGGGINDTNAQQWIEKGAEKVILKPGDLTTCCLTLPSL